MRMRLPTLLIAAAIACGCVPASAPAQKPAPEATPEPLAPPIARTPGAEPAGTVILLGGSGWAAGTLKAQQTVWSRVAPSLFAAGYRVVAIDYAAGGPGGLASLTAAVRRERARTPAGPLCVYGESSGGHLAMLAANRMPAIDCVITFGAPTSFSAFAAAVAAHPEEPGWQHSLDTAIVSTFGPDPAGWSEWEPANLRVPLRAPVLAMICEDDPVVPVDQIYHLPGAETYVAPAGRFGVPRDVWIHGTTTQTGRVETRRRILDFVERAGAALSARRSSRAGRARRRP